MFKHGTFLCWLFILETPSLLWHYWLYGWISLGKRTVSEISAWRWSGFGINVHFVYLMCSPRLFQSLLWAKSSHSPFVLGRSVGWTHLMKGRSRTVLIHHPFPIIWDKVTFERHQIKVKPNGVEPRQHVTGVSVSSGGLPIKATTQSFMGASLLPQWRMWVIWLECLAQPFFLMAKRTHFCLLAGGHGECPRAASALSVSLSTQRTLS